MHMWDGFFWGMPSGLFMGLMGFPFLLLIAVVVILIVVSRSNTPGRAQPPHQPAGQDQALAILRERYARGEIDDEEYEQRLRKLEQSQP